MSDERTPIIMYARERFCPDVTRARLRLEELGYEWTEYDVESDESRKQEMMVLTGRPNVPTLLIGKSILVEPSVEEIDNALVQAGYDVEADKVL
jgi:glutaredoxin